MYDSSKTIDLENVALNGGFLVKTLVVSIDPYLRGWMNGPEAKTYVVRVPLIFFGSLLKHEVYSPPLISESRESLSFFLDHD